MKNTEQPDYRVVMSKQNIQVRDYPHMIFAEVEVEGLRKQAIREGFQILADYIFGNNTQKKGVDQEGEKIAMTAPVMQEKHLSHWKVRFVMPKSYNLETLPTPQNKKIHLICTHPKRFAAIRFSGLPSDENLKQQTQRLQDYIKEEKLKPIGNTLLAFYNPPWTLPFLRRNEIMIEIGTPE